MDVMRFWLTMGCDGFRVDMAASLVKNDPGNEATIALWQKVRAFLDREFPEAAIISEWGEPEKSLRGGFHMDFLLHFGPSHYNDLFRCEEPFFSDRGLGDASAFVKKYLEENGGKIDYIHGEDVTERLASQPESIGFILPAMGKDQLFPTVIFDGALPRKTFSMGEANDKRFYLEARKIK